MKMIKQITLQSEPYPLYRFVCIVIAGLIAIGGIGFNILLIALFANRYVFFVFQLKFSRV